MPENKLQAPFPYFGGKARAAELIWQRFGNPKNYVEPFAGSLAVLLARPDTASIETVNDIDGLLSNAWRAIRLDPDAVAFHASQPVVEVDLTARHLYLVRARDQLTERLMADPDYYDARLAGWWVWGACTWIGSGWCRGDGPWTEENGVLIKRPASRKKSEEAGVKRKLPHLGNEGRGVNRKLPHLGNAGKGVNRQLPHGEASTDPVLAWMRELSARLRRTRVTCGSWERVLSSSITTHHGITGVLLDPPYDAENADNDVYGSEYDADVSKKVWEWAVANGDDPKLRIAFCAYEDGRELPQGWTRVRWHARKGYANSNDGNHNGKREVIYFSPHCLEPALYNAAD